MEYKAHTKGITSLQWFISSVRVLRRLKALEKALNASIIGLYFMRYGSSYACNYLVRSCIVWFQTQDASTIGRAALSAVNK